MKELIVRGQGPTWVLIHGSASDASTWAGVVARTKDRRLVTYDRPGYERTGPRAADLPEQLDRLEAVVASCEEPPLLIGASFGAVVALEWARDASRSVRGLVLIEPPLPEGPGAPPRPHDFLGRMQQLQIRDPEAAGLFFLEQVLDPGAFEAMPAPFRRRAARSIEGITGDCQALLEHTADFEGLRSLDLETLLVGGGRSLASYGRTLDALESRLSRARRIQLPDAGHMAYSDDPEAFLEGVRQFEAELR
ncbi:MAG: alpha/beta hydrolase [Myxococcota bacterium]